MYIFKNKEYSIIENNIEYNIQENEFGDKRWYLNELLHREIGPAIEYFDGYKVWYKHGEIHRTDGPAEICPNGTKKYWLNDKKYNITSDEEWILFQIIT